MNLILASKSPRRKEILESLGLDFEIYVLDTKEDGDKSDPYEYVKQNAYKKAKAVADKLIQEDCLCKNTIILSCDTVVVSPTGEIMEKPKDSIDAYRMLKSLNGKVHKVVSGFSVYSKEKHIIEYESTDVYFDEIDEIRLRRYANSDEPKDKAGAYAIQGGASLFVKKIDGDYLNVVGLPIKRIDEALKKHFGITLDAFREDLN